MRTPNCLLTLPLALAACHHHAGHHSGSGGGGTPVFLETERNDDPLTANDFGVLLPGDRFFIDGAIRDDLADPFDGFRFTAGVPIHVDFRLFANNVLADLDVCLYDPQIDQTVACFATADDPEIGGVDVFAGGLDFHLVVESFVGDSTYSLEISVLPLFTREAEALPGDGTGIRAANERAEHETDAREGYRVRQEQAARRTVLESVMTVDEESGTILEIVRVMR